MHQRQVWVQAGAAGEAREAEEDWVVGAGADTSGAVVLVRTGVLRGGLGRSAQLRVGRAQGC